MEAAAANNNSNGESASPAAASGDWRGVEEMKLIVFHGPFSARISTQQTDLRSPLSC